MSIARARGLAEALRDDGDPRTSGIAQAILDALDVGEYDDKRRETACETLRDFADYGGTTPALDRTMRFTRREARAILAELRARGWPS